MLWGVDELVTYHYLVAEVYRVVPATKLPYEQFWKMSKTGAGGPHLEAPVRRAHADHRSLPRRADDAEEARARPVGEGSRAMRGNGSPSRTRASTSTG